VNPTLPPFVQELFDAGNTGQSIDPIDDPATQSWLLEHPEALASFAALRQALHDMPATRRPARPWRPIGWSVAAAAALALVLFSIETETARPLPRPDFATTGGVVHCRATATEITGTSSRQSVFVIASTSSGRRARLGHRAQRYMSHPTPSWDTARTVKAETVEKALIP